MTKREYYKMLSQNHNRLVTLRLLLEFVVMIALVVFINTQSILAYFALVMGMGLHPATIALDLHYQNDDLKTAIDDYKLSLWFTLACSPILFCMSLVVSLPLSV